MYNILIDTWGEIMLHFIMKNNDYEIDFYSEYDIVGNIISFTDMSISNTKIEFEIGDKITLKRFGDTNMHQEFILSKLVEGTYSNELGLELKIGAFTKKVHFGDDRIEIIYDNYVNDELQGENHLQIIF